MPKFRKKPAVIEAFQMTKERRWDNSEWPGWLHLAWQRDPGENSLWPDDDAPIAEGQESAAELVLGTLEGVCRVSWGDWIIQGVKGELCPCKPDIFEATYDPVEDIVLRGDGAVLVSYVDRLAGSAAILEERKAAAKGVDNEPSGFKVRCGKCGEVVMRATFAVCQPLKD